jgi:antitoxin (DNA-binding transcriptional repressor) of toxin-antitoxin stability system
MKTVGVRELKNRLSEYIRHVRAGEGVLVTDRGEFVAELALPGQTTTDTSVPPGLVALARKGLVTLGGQSDSQAYPPLPRLLRKKKRAVQLLDEERGGR